MTHPLIRSLEQHGPLSGHDSQLLLKALGPVRTLKAGRDIIKQGSRPNESIVLLEGIAARYILAPTGRRQLTALHIIGDFVDLHSFLLKRMDHGVTAVTDCQIAGIQHEALREWATQNPALTQTLWLSTLIDGAIHRRWLAQMQSDAYSRTAHLICELFTRYRAIGRLRDNTLDLSVTQADMGDTLGMSPVHMNRTLMQFRRDGLITWQKRILQVHDFDRLKQIAGFDESYLYLTPRSLSGQDALTGAKKELAM